VALAGGTNARRQKWAKPLWVGLGAFACVGLLGFSCIAALHFGWLEPKWSGLLDYVWPLVVWQGSACLSAVYSHRPFQTKAAKEYSCACIGLTLVQAFILLGPIGIGLPVGSENHISLFALVSCSGLLTITAWAARLK
jgi:hypothetical protein